MTEENDYEGEERRVWPRRKEDAVSKAHLSPAAMVAIATLVSILVSLGAAWATAAAATDKKVDAKEQMRIDAQQDARLDLLSEQMKLVGRIDARISLIYCASIPKAKRDGCQ